MPRFEADSKNLYEYFNGNNRRFIVPDYQRGYAWTKTQLDELWLDITAISDSEYLLGSMILIDRDNGELEIVDGQQRLTTLFILITVLSRYLEKYDDNDAAAANSNNHLKSMRQFMYRGGRSREPVYRLALGGVDRDFFMRKVCLGQNVEPNKAFQSQKNITEAADFFDQKIKELDDDGGINDLLALDNKLSQLESVVIVVKEDSDAYVIFEAVNDRGMKLTVADLLKNYLIKSAGRNTEKVEIIKANWEEIITNLEGLNVVDLITYFWRAKKENVTSSSLFKVIKKHIESTDNSYTADEFTSDLRKASKAYRKIEHPVEFDDISHKTKDALMGIKLTRFKQWYPIIISAIVNDVDEPHLQSLLSEMERLSVYLKVSGFNPSSLESKYIEWANEVYENGEAVIDDIIIKIRENYPDQQSFRDAFVTRSFDVKDAKLVLIRCEQKLGGDDNNLDFDRYEVEHIMPKSLTQDWSHFSPELHEEYLNDIGNLTLLAKTPNIKGSNKAITIKMELYNESRVLLTQALVNEKYSQWTPAEIQKRGESLLAIAELVWPYPDK